MTYPHRVYVVASRREGGKRTTFRAVCDRGDYHGPNRTTTTGADKDGRQHDERVRLQPDPGKE